ncbi:MAG: putative DNA binding domain-containing protein [Bacteroidales bacterium]|jgi:predicted HTH transcriptional regulator|nr:putative DNA binding domain-containing protein [Bacteroidales bacterium]NLM93099.1 ATP-binding protein [Bacteroidales bacterium]
MSRYIHNLIAQGEHQQLDFKFQVNDSRKIARTLVAFANTDGGKLLIGVKDNGVIAGVRTDEEYHMIEAAAGMYCKPEIDFAFRPWNIDGKQVLEIDVPALKVKPAFVLTEEDRWMAYVRVGDQNILATPLQIKLWKRQSSERGIVIKYSDNERILMSYLNAHPFITLNKFSKLADIPRYKAENILVNMISAGLVEIGQNERYVWFRLSETGQKQEPNGG